MEKEPKIIGEDAGENSAIPELEESKPDKIESETGSDKLELSFPTTGGWFEVMIKHRKKLPDDMELLLRKGSKQGGFTKRLSADEYKKFMDFRDSWWLEKFGMSFFEWDERRKHFISPKEVSRNNSKREEKDKQPKVKVVPESRKDKKSRIVREIKDQKTNRMQQLHQALRNLDNGEPVDEFRDEARRVIYYDEDGEKYYIEENGEKKYLGIGDITSDYAWGIKYIPDGEMIEPAYRTVAKRILINEAKRDLEVINNIELTGEGSAKNHSPVYIEGKILEKDGEEREKAVATHIGFIAEAMARELLTRISINNDLDFAVLRANLIEDFKYRYDFKLKLKETLRGVKIEDGKEIASHIRKIGIQFTIDKSKRKKLGQVKEGKQAIKKLEEAGLKRLPVDEILLLWIPIFKEVTQAYEEWLDAGKPSGGPEQFLSRDLKVRLLKEVTKKLIEVSDEDIERIFPEEGSEKSEQAA